jgi:hypothetical protein
MLSIDLWRWYINITITILDTNHRPVFYLKHVVSETGFCIRLQVEPTQFVPVDIVSVSGHENGDRISSPSPKRRVLNKGQDDG